MSTPYKECQERMKALEAITNSEKDGMQSAYETLRYTPKVRKILAKGIKATAEDRKYLISRGLTLNEIEKYLPSDSLELSLENYRYLRNKGYAEKEIASFFKVSLSKLQVWKYAVGMIDSTIPGLTVAKYKELKKNKVSNPEICKDYKVHPQKLQGWVERNFNEEDRKSLRLTGKVKRRRAADDK